MFVVLMSVRHLLFLVVVGVTLPLAFCQKGGRSSSFKWWKFSLFLLEDRALPLHSCGVMGLCLFLCWRLGAYSYPHKFVVMMSVRHVVVVGVTLPLPFCQRREGGLLSSSVGSTHSFFLRVRHSLFITLARFLCWRFGAYSYLSWCVLHWIFLLIWWWGISFFFLLKGHFVFFLAMREGCSHFFLGLNVLPIWY